MFDGLPMPAAAWISLFPGNATILSKLREFFLSRSIPAFLVGGYVRDSLRGTPCKDVDVAVPGEFLSLAKELAGTFGGSFVALGHDHRVARVVVTSADDGRWVVDVSDLEGPVYGDQMRRDFTVDAMALAVEDWDVPGWEDRILDPLGGRRDLDERTIRAVGPWVFPEDPARLLRAVRLAATLGFRIDPDTSQLISRQAHLLSSTAGERVRDELLAVLALDGAKNHLEMLDGLGLLCCIIPELRVTKGVEQPLEHYWDVFGHSLHAVEGVERVTTACNGDPVSNLVPWCAEMEERFAQQVSDGHTRRTILKLGALLHDIAKPQTKAVDEAGRTRFLGHHTLGSSMSRQILQRLRLSNRGVDMTCGMVENHLRPTQMSQGTELATPRAVYRYFRDVGDVSIDILYLSLADHLAARGPELAMDGWRDHVKSITHILEVGTKQQSLEKTPRLITGHDLIEELGLAPGPLIGSLLEGVKDAQAGGDVVTRAEALGWVRSRLKGFYPGGSSPEVPGC